MHIGGSECNIQERNESHIICQTSSHSGSGQFNVKVMLGSDGLAYVSVSLYIWTVVSACIVLGKTTEKYHERTIVDVFVLVINDDIGQNIEMQRVSFFI